MSSNPNGIELTRTSSTAAQKVNINSLSQTYNDLNIEVKLFISKIQAISKISDEGIRKFSSFNRNTIFICCS